MNLTDRVKTWGVAKRQGNWLLTSLCGGSNPSTPELNQGLRIRDKKWVAAGFNLRFCYLDKLGFPRPAFGGLGRSSSACSEQAPPLRSERVNPFTPISLGVCNFGAEIKMLKLSLIPKELNKSPQEGERIKICFGCVDNTDIVSD